MVVFLNSKKNSNWKKHKVAWFEEDFFAVNYNKHMFREHLFEKSGLELNPNRVIRAPFCWGIFCSQKFGKFKGELMLGHPRGKLTAWFQDSDARHPIPRSCIKNEIRDLTNNERTT